MYIVVDTKVPENRSALNIDFVTQSAPEIRKKLQRQEEFERKMLSELVKIVQKNYNKQNPAKDRQTKHMTKIMVTTMAGLQVSNSKGPSTPESYTNYGQITKPLYEETTVLTIRKKHFGKMNVQIKTKVRYSPPDGGT